MLDFILELSEKNKTTVLATHDLKIPHVATNMCYVLGQDHKLPVQGVTHEILNREDILIQANLIHRHRHIHDNVVHAHKHWHF